MATVIDANATYYALEMAARCYVYAAAALYAIVIIVGTINYVRTA